MALSRAREKQPAGRPHVASLRSGAFAAAVLLLGTALVAEVCAVACSCSPRGRTLLR